MSLCRADANLSMDKLHSIAQSKLSDNLQGLGFKLTGNVSDMRPLGNQY